MSLVDTMKNNPVPTHAKLPPVSIIIFGAAGDLVWRKLAPALYNLLLNQQLPEHFAVIGIYRKNQSSDKSRLCLKEGAKKFGLGYAEMDERHHLAFDTCEEGKLSLDEYLNRVVFYQECSFSREEFKAFMYAQSQPFPEMIELMRGLKTQHGLQVAAVSNEGRELTVYRVQ
jgi:hypothetical protein